VIGFKLGDVALRASPLVLQVLLFQLTAEVYSELELYSQ
jgi:hypothetical protein